MQFDALLGETEDERQKNVLLLLNSSYFIDYVLCVYYYKHDK